MVIWGKDCLWFCSINTDTSFTLQPSSSLKPDVWRGVKWLLTWQKCVREHHKELKLYSCMRLRVTIRALVNLNTHYTLIRNQRDLRQKVKGEKETRYIYKTEGDVLCHSSSFPVGASDTWIQLLVYTSFDRWKFFHPVVWKGKKSSRLYKL